MVMHLNTGVPGSGKTYLMIERFVSLFCSWDKDTGRYLLKPEHKNKILISNIESLSLEHLDLETLLRDKCLVLAKKQYLDKLQGQDLANMDDVITEYYHDFMVEKVRWFFNHDNQNALALEMGSIIYLIEEGQRYFDTKELGRQSWVRDVLFFFEKSRHMGASIFMDTQHISKIHKGISVLFETETRAKPRTLSLFGEFKYNEYSDGMKTNSIPVIKKPDKRIYQTYKSMSLKEDIKTKKPVLKVLGLICIASIFACYMVYYTQTHLGGDTLRAVTVEDIKDKKLIASGTIKTPLPDPEIWLSLPHVMSSKGVTIVHPLTNSIMPLKDFEMPVKVQGIQLVYLSQIPLTKNHYVK